MNIITEIRIISLITILFLILFSTTSVAVDEDYFIPYTDNYGYEYDPETGTYVKTDPPEAVTLQPTVQTDTNNSNMSVNTTTTAQPMVSQIDDPGDQGGTSIPLPYLITGLAGILALSFALARTLKKQHS